MSNRKRRCHALDGHGVRHSLLRLGPCLLARVSRGWAGLGETLRAGPIAYPIRLGDGALAGQRAVQSPRGRGKEESVSAGW